MSYISLILDSCIRLAIFLISSVQPVSSNFRFADLESLGLARSLGIAKGYGMGCKFRAGGLLLMEEFKGFKGICGLLFVFSCFEEFSVYLGSDCGLRGRG